MTTMFSMRKARIMAAVITGIYLIIHIFLFFFFRHYGVTPMARFNLGSIVFYGVILIVCDKVGYYIFAPAVFIEVVLHMAGAAIFTGWESGFQITLVGTNVLLFYSEYVQRRLEQPYVRALPLAVSSMAVYLFLCVYDHLIPVRYPLPEDVCFRLQLAWGVILFTIMIAYLYFFVDLTSGSEEYLAREVGHDKLTGLPNRYYVSDYMDSLKDDAGLEGHWAAMMDIDDFKNINDSYGHNCGDYVLREIADILRGIGKDVEVSRWGGEEFLLFGRVNGDPAACRARLEELRLEIMERVFTFEELRLRLTVTIGYAEFHPGSSVHDWVNEADKKMYEGKRGGKNRLVV